MADYEQWRSLLHREDFFGAWIYGGVRLDGCNDVMRLFNMLASKWRNLKCRIVASMNDYERCSLVG